VSVELPGPQGLRVLEGLLVALALEVRPVQPVLQGHRGLVERSEKPVLEVLQVRLVQPVQRAHKALQGQLAMLVQLAMSVQPVQRVPQAQILQFRVHRAKLGLKGKLVFLGLSMTLGGS
jgi:hypothetical protein